jgi:hypothetical protein
MLEAVLALVILGGFFILRGIAATVIFFYLLPAGDRCLNCDAVTIRVESKGWNSILPWFRTSWCFECGWHGLLRHGPLTKSPATDKALIRHD